MTILEKINKNAIRNPEQLMMIQSLRNTELTLTWKQLNDYSDFLAWWIDRELTTDTPVIVYGHKNPLMIVCFIACVKSGRAYCPVDTNVPLSRVQAIADEVRPEMILATEELDIKASRIVCLKDIQTVIENGFEKISVDKYVHADDVFYIIFTSGSTGTPKGVQITRNCLDNFIKWAVSLGNGISDDMDHIFLNQAPFSFDLSVMDLFLCLYTGGTLWALSKSVQNDTKFLYNSLKKSHANVWVSTPSFVDLCMADPSFSEELLPNVTDFLFCGEILTNKTVERLMKRFPKAKVVNTYGPTESTCAVTSIAITPKLNETCIPLPVGKPKPGTWIRIIDENENIMPDKKQGEIVIVGDSVSVGYWNDPEKSKLTFGVTSEAGKTYRYYKTGDTGYLADGVLYYIGRIDLQVKLHGFRIELSDIEKNFLKIAEIEQAVVVPKYRNGKVSSLVAGLVVSRPIENEKESAIEIKERLKMNLPEYMIPKKIKFLSSIPRTNNGKIDREEVRKLL